MVGTLQAANMAPNPETNDMRHEIVSPKPTHKEPKMNVFEPLKSNPNKRRHLSTDSDQEMEVWKGLAPLPPEVRTSTKLTFIHPNKWHDELRLLHVLLRTKYKFIMCSVGFVEILLFETVLIRLDACLHH